MSMKYDLITTPNCREKLLEKLKVGETATVNQSVADINGCDR